MHKLWLTCQYYQEEDCNAFCAEPLHAMVVWTHRDMHETTEILCGWNPEVEILSVEPAPEVPRPPDDPGMGVLVRFRVVMATPEAA
jgi:hypothetical protein